MSNKIYPQRNKNHGKEENFVHTFFKKFFQQDSPVRNKAGG